MKNFISQKAQEEKTILGIDPGSLKLGWGLISSKRGVMKLLDRGLIVAKPQKAPYHDRLSYIGKELSEIVSKRRPTEIIIEDLYMKSINIKTALTIGKTYGYVWAVCEKASPESVIMNMHTSVARGLLGESRFSKKEAIRYSVCGHLRMAELEQESLDVTDALALAIARSIETRGSFF